LQLLDWNNAAAMNAKSVTHKPELFSVPDHVPANLVIPFDFHSGPEFRSNPFDHLRTLFSLPRIFYTPTHYAKSGAWVVSRNEDVRYILQHSELFSSAGSVGYSKLIGENWDMIPVELDPPRQTAFRTLLNPIFAPKEIGFLDGKIRSTVGNLVDGFGHLGGCDFISDFARPFPISIFLQIFGLPTDALAEFADWANGIMNSFDAEVMRSSMRSMVDYLRLEIRERKINPKNDLISKVCHATIDGRPITDDEIMGTSFLLFIGGLDTVTSSLAFHFHFLATHPDVQEQLRGNRSVIPAAVEELLRFFAVVSLNRRVVEDTEVAGVRMKKDDWVMVSLAAASNDPKEFASPEKFDLNRSTGAPHTAFSYGPHRCLGSHLARRELAAALNGWFDKVPQFKVKPGTEPVTHGGVIFGIENLELVW
jgi:cytochrome P450